MSTVAAKTYLTPEQYEEIEERSEVRHEYYRGEMFAMAGATEEHNLIAGNLFSELKSRLAGRGCKVYMSDMKVRVEATGLEAYPDVVALRGPARFTKAKKTTLLNPSVLVEVLSPSSRDFDRTTKWDHYKTIESLQHYVIISQDRVRVECFTREGDKWVAASWTSLSDVLPLESIGCEVPLASLYADVEVPEAPLLRPVVHAEEA